VDEPDLSAWRERIVGTDREAGLAARTRQGLVTTPAGSLGRLGDVSVWLSEIAGRCPPPRIDSPALAVFAGDHGVARTAGTSAQEPGATARAVADLVAGTAAAAVLARAHGVRMRVVDTSVDVDWTASGLRVPAEVVADRVRRGSGSIDREDAMTRAQAQESLLLGARVADALVDDGADLLIAGAAGIGSTTPAAALVGLLADAEPAAVVGRGPGMDDATWMRATAAVRDAMRRGRPHEEDPVQLLATVAGPDLAATTGFLLQAAQRRTPVLLDGLESCACALVAHQVALASAHWWAASHLSPEPAAAAALQRLGMEPLLDLGVRLAAGGAALLALPLVRAAGDLLRALAPPEPAGDGDRPGPDAATPTAGPGDTDRQ
jgi:nicotinate-nucleotide--dimethylbenzimidazole phosphoribosyltransferase